jgi:hypothetical protein
MRMFFVKILGPRNADAKWFVSANSGEEKMERRRELEAQLLNLRERAQYAARTHGVQLESDGHPGCRSWRFTHFYTGDLAERIVRAKLARLGNGNVRQSVA